LVLCSVLGWMPTFMAEMFFLGMNFVFHHKNILQDINYGKTWCAPNSIKHDQLLRQRVWRGVSKYGNDYFSKNFLFGNISNNIYFLFFII
jgi:hypothetical protein